MINPTLSTTISLNMKHWSHTALTDHPDQAWVNGAGLTRTLQVWPNERDWSLRISVATIETSAPYSRLPAVQRWHTLLEGQISLTLPDQTQTLDAQSAPFQFEGDVPCDCHLIAGPAKAFNVMLKGAHIAQVARLTANHEAQPLHNNAAIDPDVVFAGFYTQTNAQVVDSQGCHDLPAHQWLWYNGDHVTHAFSDLTLQTGQIITVLLQRTQQ